MTSQFAGWYFSKCIATICYWFTLQYNLEFKSIASSQFVYCFMDECFQVLRIVFIEDVLQFHPLSCLFVLTCSHKRNLSSAIFHREKIVHWLSFHLWSATFRVLPMKKKTDLVGTKTASKDKWWNSTENWLTWLGVFQETIVESAVPSVALLCCNDVIYPWRRTNQHCIEFEEAGDPTDM